jgi:hypothetical protein
MFDIRFHQYRIRRKGCLVFLSCDTLSCLVLPCPVMSCLALPCLCLCLCLVLPRLALSCLVLSCLVLLCLVVSCRVVSCLVMPYLILTYLVLPCLVLPCLVFVGQSGLTKNKIAEDAQATILLDQICRYRKRMGEARSEYSKGNSCSIVSSSHYQEVFQKYIFRIFRSDTTYRNTQMCAWYTLLYFMQTWPKRGRTYGTGFETAKPSLYIEVLEQQ